MTGSKGASRSTLATTARMTRVEAADRLKAEQQVLDIVGELVTEVGPRRAAVGLDDSLDRTLGLGSLERVELLVRLDAAFGVRLPDALMVAADTPRDLAAALLAAEPQHPRGQALHFRGGGLRPPPSRRWWRRSAGMPTPRPTACTSI